MLVLAGTVAAQEPTTPPPPPASPAMPQAAPVPAPAPKARSRVQVYRAMPAVAGTGSYLGVDIRDLSSKRAAELKLKSDQGVEITMVDQDSPAGKAGLKENDVVVTFNGNNVQSAEQFRRIIRETKPGQSVSLGIIRDGQPTSITATLGDRGKMFGGTMPKVYSMNTPPPGGWTVHIPDV